MEHQSRVLVDVGRQAWLHRRAVKAIAAAGGNSHPNSPCRFIFTNPAITPNQVRSLVPHFANIPVTPNAIDKRNCIVLNFVATPSIDEKVVLPLTDSMERVLVFYRASNGKGIWSASRAVRNEMRLASK